MQSNVLRWILGSAGLLALAGAAATQESALKPVASVTQIMQAMVVPSSNALFDVPRNPPVDERGWAAVRNHAIVLAESGNLLLIGDRAQDSEVWTQNVARPGRIGGDRAEGGSGPGRERHHGGRRPDD